MNKKVNSKQLGEKREIRSLKYIPILLLVFMDVLFFEKSSDFRTFPILLLYIFMIYRFKIRSTGTFIICFILFIVMYIHFIISSPQSYEAQYPKVPLGEKLAVWIYIFLIVGVIQKWREIN